MMVLVLTSMPGYGAVRTSKKKKKISLGFLK